MIESLEQILESLDSAAKPIPEKRPPTETDYKRAIVWRSIKSVADRLNMTKDELLQRRDHRATHAKHVAWWLAAHLGASDRVIAHETGMSIPNIAVRIRKIEGLVEDRDPFVMETLRGLM